MVVVFGPRSDLFGAFKAPRGSVEENYPFVSRIGGRQPTVTQRFMAHLNGLSENHRKVGATDVVTEHV